MKVLFLGDIADAGSSGLQRAWALEQCGAEVTMLDKQKFSRGFGPWPWRIGRLLSAPSLTLKSSALEKELLTLANEIKPDIIWLEWAREISPEVIASLRTIQPRPTLISFQDDNPWGDRHSDQWIWKNYFKAVPYFDLHLVKRLTDIDHLVTLGAKKCRLWKHGIYSPLFNTDNLPRQKKYPVSFVGTCFDQRGSFVEGMLEAGLPLHVFGNMWSKRYPALVHKYSSNFHNAVVGNDYAEVIKESHLSLIMVSDSNRDEWTMRSYEVPGCGTTALIPRTPVHEIMFTDGHTGLFYSNLDSCIKIADKALARSSDMEQIGKRAHEFFIDQDWTIEARMMELITELRKPDFHITTVKAPLTASLG